MNAHYAQIPHNTQIQQLGPIALTPAPHQGAGPCQPGTGDLERAAEMLMNDRMDVAAAEHVEHREIGEPDLSEAVLSRRVGGDIRAEVSKRDVRKLDHQQASLAGRPPR